MIICNTEEDACIEYRVAYIRQCFKFCYSEGKVYGQFKNSDLCIDSFEAISIIVEIENTFNIEMPDNCLAIEFLNSIEDISKKITEVIEKKTIV